MLLFNGVCTIISTGDTYVVTGTHSCENDAMHSIELPQFLEEQATIALHCWRSKKFAA
jgi:hypothetical protein